MRVNGTVEQGGRNEVFRSSHTLVILKLKLAEIAKGSDLECKKIKFTDDTKFFFLPEWLDWIMEWPFTEMQKTWEEINQQWDMEVNEEFEVRQPSDDVMWAAGYVRVDIGGRVQASMSLGLKVGEWRGSASKW